MKKRFFLWRSAHRELDLGDGPLLSLDGRVRAPAPQQCRSTGGGDDRRKESTIFSQRMGSNIGTFASATCG